MVTKETIQELKNEYSNHLTEIELLLTFLQRIPDTGNTERASVLEKAQGILNTLHGYKQSDVLIDIQVIINQYRCEYDITDPREIIHTDNGRGFVQ